MTTPLLQVEGASVRFHSRARGAVDALVDVSTCVGTAETVGVVGESGSGKSTLARAVLGLQRLDSGTVTFAGRRLAGRRSTSERRTLANDLQVVFQDPYSSLNPARTVGQSLAEPLRWQGVGKVEAVERVHAILERVGLNRRYAARFPRQFSGGQLQRIAPAPHDVRKAVRPRIAAPRRRISAHTDRSCPMAGTECPRACLPGASAALCGAVLFTRGGARGRWW